MQEIATVLRHLGEALDTIRKREYARLSGRDRRYIKGQKYTLLSRRENLTLDGKRALKALLAANKRSTRPTSSGESETRSYEREGWALRFFENWSADTEVAAARTLRDVRRDDRPSLGRHRELLPSENKVALGFVEGLNNKIGRPRAFVRNIAVAAIGVEDECAILPAQLSPTFPPTTWIASPSGSESLVSTLPEMVPPLVTAAELTAALGTRLPWISFSRVRRSRYELAFTEQSGPIHQVDAVLFEPNSGGSPDCHNSSAAILHGRGAMRASV